MSLCCVTHSKSVGKILPPNRETTHFDPIRVLYQNANNKLSISPTFFARLPFLKERASDEIAYAYDVKEFLSVMGIHQFPKSCFSRIRHMGLFVKYHNTVD